AGRASRCWVRAEPDRLIVDHQAVQHYPGHADTAQRAAVGALSAPEGVVGDVDRPAFPRGEHADGGAAEVGAGVEAAVVDETGVHGLELAAFGEDGAAAVVTGLGLPDLAVAAGEREVLHDQLRPLLVEAVGGGELLLRVAGVHVQDLPLARAAQRDLAAAV